MTQRTPLALLALLAACASGDSDPSGDRPTPSGVGVEPSAIARTAGASGAHGASAPAVTTLTIESPCPAAGARFGVTSIVLDFDGDGSNDIAAGATDQGGAYVLFGDGTLGGSAFTRHTILDERGPARCPLTPNDHEFGADLAAGELDGDTADELAVGAPNAPAPGQTTGGSVFVFGLAALGNTPLVIAPTERGDVRFGHSLACGDFDDDGALDIAIGSPRAEVDGAVAGEVHVVFGPFDRASRRLVLPNPVAVRNGNFGHDLSVGDANGDGKDDLYVSAVGNTADSVPVAGQVYYYPAPIAAETFQAIEDPFKDAADLPRFGMSIDARSRRLLVGSPRKDWDDVVDSGLGFAFDGPALEEPDLFVHPTPRPADVLGFRAVLPNFVGDATPDIGFAALPGSGRGRARPRASASADRPARRRANPLALYVWDGAAPTGAPLEVLGLPDAGDHFIQGVSYGPIVPGGYEEIVMGDPTWDAPGQGQFDNSGRLVVVARDAAR